MAKNQGKRERKKYLNKKAKKDAHDIEIIMKNSYNINNSARASAGIARKEANIITGYTKNIGGISLNKAELVSKVAEKTGLSKKDAEKAVVAVFDSIQATLKAGDKVQLVGFGTFETRKRGARTGRNPRSGATIQIPASKVPAFKAGKALKDAIG